MCTSLFSPLYDQGYLDYDYFGRLDYSFITLFQMLTTDTWLVIVRQVMDAYPYSYWLFFLWVTLTAIIILNLIIAIICESLIELKEEVRGNDAADASTTFKMQVPIEKLLKQQAEIARIQLEMEVVVNALMLRFPTNQSIKGTARGSFVAYQ